MDKELRKLTWSMGDNAYDEAFEINGYIDFFCGEEDEEEPELWDEENSREVPVLQRIFHDHVTDLGAAECYHLLYANEGETLADLIKLLRERMKKAGIEHT